MKNKRSFKKKQDFFIKYFMIKAGNDSKKLKKEMESILAKLEKMIV